MLKVRKIAQLAVAEARSNNAIGVTSKTTAAPSHTPQRPSACAAAIRRVFARLPTKAAPTPLVCFFGFIDSSSNFHLAAFDLVGWIYECEFLPSCRASPSLYAIKMWGSVYVPIRPVIRI
jgi:hypothetical protein